MTNKLKAKLKKLREASFTDFIQNLSRYDYSIWKPIKNIKAKFGLALNPEFSFLVLNVGDALHDVFFAFAVDCNNVVFLNFEGANYAQRLVCK